MISVLEEIENLDEAIIECIEGIRKLKSCRELSKPQEAQLHGFEERKEILLSTKQFIMNNNSSRTAGNSRKSISNSCETPLSHESRDCFRKLRDNIVKRKSIVSIFVNGQVCSIEGLSTALKRNSQMNSDMVSIILQISEEVTVCKELPRTMQMTEGLNMLNTGILENVIQEDSTFYQLIYSADSHVLDTQSLRCMGMAPCIDEDGNVRNINSGMSGGMSDTIAAFLEWKSFGKKLGEGVLRGSMRVLAAHDKNTMFRKVFSFVVDEGAGWLIYLENDLDIKQAVRTETKIDSYQPKLHFMRIAVADIAPLWFAIHARTKHDPFYVFNEYSAELLIALKALGVPWQWSGIQLLGMSSSRVFLVSPGDAQQVTFDSKKQFALKMNPFEPRCNREVESVRRVAEAFASGADGLDPQLHYACGVVHRDGSKEFFQPQKLGGEVKNSLRCMFEENTAGSAGATYADEAQTIPSPPVSTSRTGRALRKPARYSPEDVRKVTTLPAADGWFQTGRLPVPPHFTEGAGEQYLIMHVGKELVEDISQTDYVQLMQNLSFAHRAKIMHCDVRRRANCMHFDFGDAARRVCQLVDWDLSVNCGEKVTLHRGSGQRREAPASIQWQLQEDTRKNGGVERDTVDVDWQTTDDVLMLVEYMWEVAKNTGERLNGVK